MGLLMVALLPMTAAIAADSEPPDIMLIAITQPIAVVPGSGLTARTLPEPGLILLVGSGLLGLASVVRRYDRDSR